MKEPAIEQTVSFCRTLREHGLGVTPSEAVDAVKSLGLIDVGDRDETFLSLRSVLASRVEDFPIFAELFEEFWRGLIQNPRPQKLVEPPEAESTAGQRSRLTERRAANGIAYYLEHWSRSESRDESPINMPGASDATPTGEKDFNSFNSDGLSEIARLARRIVKRLARNRSRRWKPVRRGTRVHMRRSLRRSSSTGGELIELSFKERKTKKTRLVVICDVSGSMDLYSRLLLQFVYGLQNSFARVETFVFSTALERITGHLRNRSYRRALDRLASNVRGWSGGTLIGESIAAFNSRWGRLLDKRTIVIILSDGWDTGEPAELAASLERLKGRAARLIWLNPLLGSASYQPLTRGMRAALPHIDVFGPAHNLASLRALEPHLAL
ncbi:MAG TPA: VWA domain-containing protein [Blastocatellia bacterium]|nr:VWA domain-containing protein [Blastocatellia bacterium]